MILGMAGCSEALQDKRGEKENFDNSFDVSLHNDTLLTGCEHFESRLSMSICFFEPVHF